MACTPRHPPARLPHRSRDRAGRPRRRPSRARGCRRRARAERRPAPPPSAGSISTRACVRDELPRVDAPPERVEPPAPEERRTPPAAHLAVEEDGQPELVSDPGGERARGRDFARSIAVGRERDERDDVGCADPRVHAEVLAEVDALDGRRDAGEERVEQRRPPRPTSVNTERCGRRPSARRGARRSSRTRRRSRRSTAGLAPLRDVGHGLEHDPYPTKPCPTRSREARADRGWRTFVRLLGFLRPYRASLAVSSVLAIASRRSRASSCPS